MRVGTFMVEFLVKNIRIRPFRREQLRPLGFFKLVTAEKQHYFTAQLQVLLALNERVPKFPKTKVSATNTV